MVWLLYTVCFFALCLTFCLMSLCLSFFDIYIYIYIYRCVCVCVCVCVWEREREKAHPYSQNICQDLKQASDCDKEYVVSDSNKSSGSRRRSYCMRIKKKDELEETYTKGEASHFKPRFTHWLTGTVGDWLVDPRVWESWLDFEAQFVILSFVIPSYSSTILCQVLLIHLGSIISPMLNCTISKRNISKQYWVRGIYTYTCPSYPFGPSSRGRIGSIDLRIKKDIMQIYEVMRTKRNPGHSQDLLQIFLCIFNTHLGYLSHCLNI